jgi:hypothetical protein
MLYLTNIKLHTGPLLASKDLYLVIKTVHSEHVTRAHTITHPPTSWELQNEIALEEE